MGKKSNPQLVDRWQRRLTDYRQTKQTVAAFCRSEGVSVPSFYSWKKRLKAQPPWPKTKSARVSSRLDPASTVFERVNILTSDSVSAIATDAAASVIRLGPHLEIELGTHQPTVETIVFTVLKSLVCSIPSSSNPAFSTAISSAQISSTARAAKTIATRRAPC